MAGQRDEFDILLDDAGEDGPEVIMTKDGAITPGAARAQAQAGTLGELEDEAGMLETARLENVEERLGTLGQVQAGIEGAAAGLTFGASRLLDAGDPFAARDQLERQRTFGKTALGGEIGGALLGALASGGQSLGGTLARLTPRAALEAAAIRAIGQAATTGTRALRGVGFGVVEGGLDVAGNYIARVALDDDKEFSGAELGRTMLAGALLGGVGGGIGGAITPAAGRSADELLAQARRVIPDEQVAEIRRLLGEALPEGRRSQSAATRSRVWKKTDAAELDEIASETMIARSRGSYTQLQERIADAGRRTGTADVDDVLSAPMLRAALDPEEYGTLGAKLRGLAADRDDAVAAARRWAEQHAQVVGKPKNAKELAQALKRVPAALEDEAGTVLARFDQTVTALDGELAKVRSARALVDGLAPAGTAAAMAPGIGARVRTLLGGLVDRATGIKTTPGAKAVIEGGEKVIAASEVAQTMGLPVPSISSLIGRDNVVGQAVGLFLQARAGARVLNKAGAKLGITSTPLTRAARAVNAGRARVTRAIDEGLAAATGRVRRAAAPILTTGAVKALGAVDGAALREQAALDALDLPSDVAALAIAQVERVAGYLDRVRPKNPNAGTPWSRSWSPGPVAEAEYARRARAALDPEAALVAALSGPGASLEIEALAACHPDVFARAQSALLAVAADDQLREQIPEALRQSLGHGFHVPLAINQLPGYGALRIVAPPLTPAPSFGQPSAASTNTLVTAEQMDGPGARRRT